MSITLTELKSKDYKKAIQFAIDGMHFSMYLNEGFMLNVYGTYFLYDELNKATQVIAAYEGDNLVGLLLADIKGEPKKYETVWKTVYAGVVNFIQHRLFKEGVENYDQANKELFAEYLKNNSPDGQIVFLAADPLAKIKGIGTILLKELEKREKGKQVYLYTDDACTYQFYEHRGFDRAGEKDVVLELGEKQVPLKCMLYSKIL